MDEDDLELEYDSEDEELPDQKSMLELQLAELEMLKSMYGNPGEFQLDGDEAVDLVTLFVNGDMEYEFLEARIGFTVKLTKDEVDVICRYPHGYPAEPPDVFLRTCLPRANNKLLTDDLYNFIRQQPRCELMMVNILDWIHNHIGQYKRAQAIAERKDRDSNECLARYWIYSHHIYSKFKRKDILDWAKDYGLTGFSMPGKPGVVCAEGPESLVEEYWSRLRRLNWRKLAIKHIEKSGTDVKGFRKFANFEEKNFDVRGGKGREYHMDLGKFLKFLEENGSQEVYKMYFGVEGRVNDGK